jgi:hypothetical protein
MPIGVNGGVSAWRRTALLTFAGIINGVLMLAHGRFGKARGVAGIIVSSFALPSWIPGIGVLFLFLNTIGMMAWYSMLSVSLARLARE